MNTNNLILLLFVWTGKGRIIYMIQSFKLFLVVEALDKLKGCDASH